MPGKNVGVGSASDAGLGSRFDYIDALRGYAILGVIAVHTSQLFANLQWPLRLIADQGARGVQLFFVVSALTLTFSWNNRSDGALPFWVRRAFRIVPMFWLALTYYVVLVGFLDVHLRWGPREIAWRDILASAALVHGLHPATIDSIIPGGWSIADEAGFYAIFPLLMSVIRSWRAAAIGLFLSAAALFAVSPFLPIVENLGELLPFQLPAFLVGILLFYLMRDFSGRISRNLIRIGLGCALVAALLLPFLVALLPGRIHWAIYLFPGQSAPVLCGGLRHRGLCAGGGRWSHPGQCGDPACRKSKLQRLFLALRHPRAAGAAVRPVGWRRLAVPDDLHGCGAAIPGGRHVDLSFD